MAKGNPKDDREVYKFISALKLKTASRNLVKLDQKTLRDFKHAMEHSLADVNRYLDIRNEQGRGGKK
jgi:hypothetical protein